ncbi:hypothetical protein [Streptomyces sp. NPDC048442]|uniref:hypothetical protein n=1 Tax=Streptomyces sp. NPDC048442 TaxID=3154823 RepID=UPI0034363414
MHSLQSTGRGWGSRKQSVRLAAVGLASAALVVGAAGTASASSASFGCNDSGPAGPLGWCGTVYPTSTDTVTVKVTNHASGGEVCRLTVTHVSYPTYYSAQLWINYGDNSAHNFRDGSNTKDMVVNNGSTVTMNCQRRSSSTADIYMSGTIFYGG